LQHAKKNINGDICEPVEDKAPFVETIKKRCLCEYIRSNVSKRHVKTAVSHTVSHDYYYLKAYYAPEKIVFPRWERAKMSFKTFV
jgi:hypothetical protein